MLLELRENVLNRLYNHAECDHETLLQVFVAYEMPNPDYREIHLIVGTMNNFTQHAWSLETCPY
jgi:regulatory protein YycH of two-component signal transduction system YycFG